VLCHDVLILDCCIDAEEDFDVLTRMTRAKGKADSVLRATMSMSLAGSSRAGMDNRYAKAGFEAEESCVSNESSIAGSGCSPFL
jgi:hypothetical protein